MGPSDRLIDEVAERYERLLEAVSVAGRGDGAVSRRVASPGMRETPRRAARALLEMIGGYYEDPAEILATTFDGEEYDQMIVVRGIPFVSLCEHHLMPFEGTVDVGYVPTAVGRVVGLSKIPRLVRCFSRRFQLQERLTKEIAGALKEHLSPEGVAVTIRARHSCMRTRGVETEGEMVTSELLGCFREDHRARAEFFGL